MKIIIIANRLPVKIERKEKEFCITRSEGGLATGLGSLETESELYWVGWPGIHTEDENEKLEIREKLHELNFHPVFTATAQYGRCVITFSRLLNTEGSTGRHIAK
jgi:trehalose 6-phosphate synthase/phosphatase